MSNGSEIYKQGYVKWEGERGQAQPAWVLIGKAGLKNLVAAPGCISRLGRLVFFAGFIIYYFSIVITTIARMQLVQLQKYEPIRDIAQALAQGMTGISEAQIHMTTILWQSFAFTIFAMVFYGSQLISKDRRANALQVYFSKSISRSDYVLGKFAAIAAMTATVTLIPSALILFFGLATTTEHLKFLTDSWHIAFLTTAYWLLLTLVYGSLTLFFSSCFNKSYMAGVAIIGFQLFCMVVSMILVAIFGISDILDSLNWTFALYNVGKAIYQLEVPAFGRFFWQICTLGALTAVSLGWTFRKIEPVEVVK